MVKIVREVHDVNPAVESILLREGGLNRFGEPNFRAVWTNTRLEWVKGDFDSLHLRPKYEHKLDRWCIERFRGPETYANGTWDESELGPFPTRGDYEASLFIETPITCEFIQLTPSIAREVVRRVLESERFSRWEREVALKEREAAKEREQDRIRHDVFSNNAGIYTGSYVSVL
jgi:hypothetical protein